MPRSVACLGLFLVLGNGMAADPATAASEFQRIAGYWKPVSIKYDGVERFQDTKPKDGFTLVVRNDEYALFAISDKARDEGYRLVTASLTLSPEGKTLNFEIKDGARKGEKCHGIYDVVDGQLKLCYGPAVKPRPTTFDAPAGSLLFSEVWTPEVSPKR